MSTLDFPYGADQVLPVSTVAKDKKGGKEAVQKVPVLEESVKKKIDVSRTQTGHHCWSFQSK